MKIEEMQKPKRKERTSVCIQLTKEDAEWLQENNISNTKLFVNALNNLRTQLELDKNSKRV